MSVTLSMQSTRRAVVMVDDRPGTHAPDVAGLVEHAVRDAFVFDAVDVVEVRRRSGELLERRSRRGLLSA
jgi:Ethanolamine utilization protein EutJ (predicted chaperonin)